MTATTWEYMSVSYAVSRERLQRDDPRALELSDAIRAEWDEKEWGWFWWREHHIYLAFPGKPAEKRLAWTEGYGDRPKSTDMTTVLNELGAAGWELISHTVSASTVGPELGWEPAGFPIQHLFYFKRPVAS